MIECDTPLLKKLSKSRSKNSDSPDPTSFEQLSSSSEDESFEEIEDNMEILDDDHDPTRWI
jgi:hypothetical protein